MSLFIGIRNSEQVTGLPWRHVRDHYRHLAVRVGRKLVIPADALVAAIRGDQVQPGQPAAPADAAATVRAMLGWRSR